MKTLKMSIGVLWLAFWIVFYPARSHGTYSDEVLADTPVGYWKLDETACTSAAADSSGNAHDGTYSSDTYTHCNESPLISVGKSIRSEGYHPPDPNGGQGPIPVYIPSHADFNLSAAFTLEGWIDVTAYDHCFIERKAAAGGYGFLLATDSAKPRVYFRDSGGAGVGCGGYGYSCPTLQDGDPHHVAATVTGKVATIYVDGVACDTCDVGYCSDTTTTSCDVDGDCPGVETCTARTVISTSGIALTGASCWTGSILNGKMDELAIYATALSAARILVHYNEGAGVAPTSTPTSSPTSTAAPTATATPTATDTGTLAPTDTPTATGTPTPTVTPTALSTAPPCDGTGHDLLCRGGGEQGKKCALDADCAGGGTCTRHGHPASCLEQCSCWALGQSGYIYNYLGGSAGDHIADLSIGACSTEDNIGDLKGHPAGVGRPVSVSYDTTNDVLWVGESYSSVVKGWSGSAITTTNSNASYFVGQRDAFNQRWDRLPGDLTVGGGVQDSVTRATLAQVPSIVTSSSTGILWVGQLYSKGRMLRFGPSIPAVDAQADQVLCQDSFTGFVEQPINGRCGSGNVAYAPNHSYVAVGAGHRVFIFNTGLPVDNGVPCTGGNNCITLGQTDATVDPKCNRNGAVAANTLCGTAGVAFSEDGYLFVGDAGNNRILRFKPGVDGLYANNQSPDLVYGQPDFITNTPGTSATKLRLSVIGGDPAAGPAVPAIGDGNLAIADLENNRVVLWNNIASTDATADQVIGQSGFTTNSWGLSATALRLPQSVTFGKQRVIVADWFSNRVTAYTCRSGCCSGVTDYHPICSTVGVLSSSGPAASSVLGQKDLVTDESGKVNAQTFNIPNKGGVAFTSTGGVFIADENNHRVLYWSNKVDAYHGQPATTIIGQGTQKDDRYCNRGGSVGANTLCNPMGLAVDSLDRLWIADQSNHRIVRLSSPYTGDFDFSYGQDASLTTNTLNKGGLDATALAYPRALTYAPTFGYLWVTDFGNHRTLVFTLSSSSQSASRVLGQTDVYNSSSAGCSAPTASSQCNPVGVAVDLDRTKAYVSDMSGVAGQGRLLAYDIPVILPTNGQAASAAGGTASLTAWSTCKTDPDLANGCNIAGVAVHPVTHDIYVVENPGVVRYSYPLSTGEDISQAYGLTTPVEDPAWLGNRAANAGYINCQWDANGTGIAFDPVTYDMWVVEGETQRGHVSITLDPQGSTPTPTGTLAATSTPTVTNTPTATWTSSKTPTAISGTFTPTPTVTSTSTGTPATGTPTPSLSPTPTVPTATPSPALPPACSGRSLWKERRNIQWSIKRFYDLEFHTVIDPSTTANNAIRPVFLSWSVRLKTGQTWPTEGITLDLVAAGTDSAGYPTYDPIGSIDAALPGQQPTLAFGLSPLCVPPGKALAVRVDSDLVWYSTWIGWYYG